MSKISVIIIFILLLKAGTSFAQNYFVFIGSDNRQPFYVRVDSEFHSSSAEGHLILAQLKDSTYNITIGFPGQPVPEQHYVFNIQGKDQAFELRLRDAEGLRLYDLEDNQWLSMDKGGRGMTGDSGSAGIKKDDAFSRLMAGVVRDTAVLYNTYAMERALSDSPTVAAATQSAPASNLAAAGTQTNAPAPATQSIPTDTATSTAAINTPPSSTTPTPTATQPSSITPTPTAVPSPTATPPTTAALPMTAASPGPAVSGAASAPTASLTGKIPTDTTTSRPVGVITHQAAARFNDSSTRAPLYRHMDSAATTATAPIPGTVGAPLYRTVPPISKLSERHTQKNVRLVYADRSGGGKNDTIVVIIPVDSPAVAKTTGRQPHAADSNHPAARAHVPSPNADSPAASPVGYRATVPPAVPAEGSRSHPADSSHKPGKGVAFINSDCHDFATDFDVDKLRIRMLQSVKDEDRMALARKAFKVKCFYTKQIRALSEVFATDATKFRFFEAAWPFAADDHFDELSTLLSDPEYIGKFKTMTHQQ